MPGALPGQEQGERFRPLPIGLIDRKHELALLSGSIGWDYFEREFAPLYANAGQSGVPIRLMAGRLIVKQVKNLGDKTLAKEWVENPYMPYFCGMRCFEHRFPFDPSGFVHFRKP
jgi:IS5 family transposase